MDRFLEKLMELNNELSEITGVDKPILEITLDYDVYYRLDQYYLSRRRFVDPIIPDIPGNIEYYRIRFKQGEKKVCKCCGQRIRSKK